MEPCFAKRHLALIGLPASGKTAVARCLSGLLGLPAIDLDDAIEKEAGMGIPAIFAREGEAGFRAREREALARAAQTAPLILSTGGGVVLAPENRLVLRERFLTIWLRVSPVIAAARSAGGRRPLLEGGDVETKIRRLQGERDALYEECAALSVNTDELDPDGVARTIHDMLR
jgi:shikimate kinase